MNLIPYLLPGAIMALPGMYLIGVRLQPAIDTLTAVSLPF